jgi:hypothetical protein
MMQQTLTFVQVQVQAHVVKKKKVEEDDNTDKHAKRKGDDELAQDEHEKQLTSANDEP